jgi:hypothetical protein
VGIKYVGVIGRALDFCGVSKYGGYLYGRCTVDPTVVGQYLVL